ncbi:MAG: SH3 domain-containing protein [Ardenticatenaceae bacterium]|nr:SH3 domain-containing protein [Ardenticatenaceae bacterium]
MRAMRYLLIGWAALMAVALLAGCGELTVEARPPATAALAANPSATAVSPAKVATDATLVLAQSTTAGVTPSTTPAVSATVATPTTTPAVSATVATPTATPTASATLAVPTVTATVSEPAAVVLASSLNGRSGPGVAYPVISVLKQGSTVRALAFNPDRSWVQVALDPRRGWVAVPYVRLEQATSLAVATDIPPPPPTPTPLPAPTASPTPTTLPAPVCDTVPLRGFGVVWAQHPEIQPLLGCPNYQQAERGTQAAIQPFERGQMIWVGDDGGYQPTDPTFVLFDTGDWAFFPEIGTATIEETPPPGLYPPEDVFARVWRDGTGAQVRERLGWATAPLVRGAGAVQAFWNGRMIWVGSTDTIYVLIERWGEHGHERIWFQFEDTFEG